MGLPSGAPGVVGSSIALVLGGTRVAVVNPDQGSVSLLDPGSLRLLSTVDVAKAGEPHTLLEVTRDGQKELFVASSRTGEVVSLDLSKGTVLRRTHVCAGPYGLAASPDGSWVAVSCEWDGSVQKLEVTSGKVSPLATGLRRPRALAVVGASVWVADFVGGLVHEVPASGAGVTSLAVGTSLVPAAASYRPALTKMTANLASAMAPAFGALYVSHVLENNTGEDTGEPEASDYGSVTSTNPKINPSVTLLGGGEPVTYAQFDGGSRVYSGPSALASFGSRYLLVAHVSTANVAVLDTQATTPETRAVGSFSVGFGPSGLAVDEAHHVAYVDNALDLSVSRIDLTQGFASPAPLLSASATLVRELPSPFSADALAGRRLFFDATNPHITPSGVVACASCHPGGGDDGLVWFIHTPNIPLKRRRTPHLANAKSGSAPFHWNGQYATMGDLVEGTMTNLMAGDGLLVDVSTMQPYLDEAVLAPVLPAVDAASVTRGDALFHAAPMKCAGCHEGALLTDDLLHTVLSPMSLTSDDVIPASNTPGLHGMFLMAPYLHDGRAETLHDVLTQPYAEGMDHTAALSEADLSDLIAYVNSL